MHSWRKRERGRQRARETTTIVVSASEARLITPDQVTKSAEERKGKLGKAKRMENEKKSSLKRLQAER